MPKAKWKVVTKDRKSARTMDSKYIRTYLKNTTVEAQKGSLGLMLFDTRTQARKWGKNLPKAKILKVMPIGERKIPTILANEKYYNLFYKHKKRFTIKKVLKKLQEQRKQGSNSLSYDFNGLFIVLWPVPEGTVCYPAVEVLT